MPVVDLRFVVHKREDVELATKSLVAFNKVSLLRQTNYDAEAAAAKRGMTATTKLLSLDRKLTTQRKIEAQMVEDGLMSKKAQAEASDRYDRILEQETRTLQDYIDTDRVLVKEQRDAAKAEEALSKQRTKTKNETEKLRKTYDSTYAATKRYKQGLLDIDRAFEGMEDGPERASRAIKALKSDYQAFISASKSGGIVDAGNQFARYGDQAYRAQQRTKRFASVGLQQAGYQVNDFIVQIASGQNALVAFGQQGSQLAGIFGTRGAIAGAIIAAVAALGNLVYQAYMAQKGIKTLEDALSDLGDALSMVSEAEQTIADIGSGEHFGHMAEQVDILAESLRSLGISLGLVELKAGMKSVTDINMGLTDEFIAGTIKQGKDLALALIPFEYFLRKRKTLEEEMLDTQATEMAGDLFGPDSSKVGYTEAFLQDLAKLQEEPALNAEKISKRVTRFVAQADSWGFEKGTADGKKLMAQLIELANKSAEIAEAQSDSARIAEAAADAEEKRVKAEEKSAKALDDLVAKAVKMGGVNQANGARELLIAKQKREALDEFEKLKKAGVDVTEAEAKTAMAALLTAHEAALAKFDALAAEKERLKVAEAVAKALKQEADLIEKARKAAQAIIDQQAKAYKTEQDSLDTQRDKNELLRIEEEHGKKSEQALEQRIAAAQNLVSIRMTEKFLAGGITDAEADLIAEALQVAEQGERFADSLQRSLENTRLMNTEISKMQGLINNMADFGSGVKKRLAKAEAVGKALREGTPTSVAGAISDQNFDNQKVFDASKAQVLKLPPEMQEGALTEAQDLYDSNNKLIPVLEKRLLLNAKLAASKKTSGGAKTPKSALDILLKEERSMSLKLDQRSALIGLTEKEARLENAKYGLMSKVQEQMATMSASQKAATIAEIEGIAQKYAAEQELVILREEIDARNKALADSIAGSMGDAFMSMVDGTKSVKDAFKDMARAIIKELYEVLVVQRLVGDAKAGTGIAGVISRNIPSFANADGNAFSRGNVVPNANGNAMNGGNVVPFAKGGAVSRGNVVPFTNGGAFNRGGLMPFTKGGAFNRGGLIPFVDGGVLYDGDVLPFANGGVIGSPTTFPMSAGRTGLMGEAGPEAIMPLKRGANGKLGVQAEGSGSSNVIIHQSFNFAANGDESVKKLIAQAAPKIASMTKSSIISDRRRGGQMKATFG